jgi:hypothetical protein
MCLDCGCGDHTVLVCPECGGRVILINGEPKCLSCDASPSLEAVSAEHGEPHHHSEHAHPHDKAAKAESEDVLAKLRVLLPHWIEHNAEHAESFCTWAARARAAGAEHLAAHVEEAAGKIAAANRDLEDALKHIEAATSDHGHLERQHSR